MDFAKLIIEHCGLVGYILLGAQAVSLWIFMERFFFFHKSRVNVETFLRGLFNLVRNHKVVEAAAICDTKPSPVSMVVRAVIMNYEKGDTALRMATDEAAMTELPRLERGVKLIAGIGNMAPVLGLLGTLLSLMNIFSQIEDTGNFTPMAQLVGPVMSAMFTTAVGLIVALTSHCFYYVLTESLATIVGDMEKASAEMTQFMLSEEWKSHEGENVTAVQQEGEAHDTLEK